jgi:hypothetical protein
MGVYDHGYNFESYYLQVESVKYHSITVSPTQLKVEYFNDKRQAKIVSNLAVFLAVQP